MGSGASPVWPKSHRAVKKPGLGALPHPDRHDHIDMAQGPTGISGALSVYTYTGHDTPKQKT
ncbi:hypothetical protein AOE01nite_05560 [Acetobacter oeni]|uniref:Uncharacterized protein n=1 Tax=Acetobacter oeni TaxID=304077 RepID=A0A511XHC0_9PROT|nr:hypothetical protein [Acetobacter oeni]GBR03229.1 hypothetical protein AA21952_0992 [Acetobacter oeni LMG 21952]GEN62332.1 hypothetical protein AOE01nite_05560 [Acetobacter oeni]